MDNLTNYFLLPLVIEGGTTAFGKGNYINGYLSDCNKLMVSVRKESDVQPRVYQSPFYIGSFDTSVGITFLAFKFPAYFEEDVTLFRKGMYSRMSTTAKGRIRLYSGLVYRKFSADLGDTVTHKRLMALDRSPVLRRELEAALDIRLSEDSELLSSPEETEFIHLNLDEDELRSENQSEARGVNPGVQD